MSDRLQYLYRLREEIYYRLKELDYTNKHDEHDYLIELSQIETEICIERCNSYEYIKEISDVEIKNELRQKKLDSL